MLEENNPFPTSILEREIIFHTFKIQARRGLFGPETSSYYDGSLSNMKCIVPIGDITIFDPQRISLK